MTNVATDAMPNEEIDSAENIQHLELVFIDHCVGDISSFLKSFNGRADVHLLDKYIESLAQIDSVTASQ